MLKNIKTRTIQFNHFIPSYDDIKNHTYVIPYFSLARRIGAQVTQKVVYFYNNGSKLILMQCYSKCENENKGFLAVTGYIFDDRQITLSRPLILKSFYAIACYKAQRGQTDA
jgi:hypothetical protein